MLFSNIEGMSTVSAVHCRQKGSANKISVACPDVIKLYNRNMGGVDLIDQRTAAYRLDQKSSIQFYLRIFFDLMDVACANAFVVYNMLHPADLNLLDYKIAIATHLIGSYTSRTRAALENNIGKKRKHRYQHEPDDTPTHLPEFQNNGSQCVYCYTEGFDRKTSIKCTECGVFLCLVKERNCFFKHHM